MLFNSLSFLVFFAVVGTVYYAVPHRFRWPLLLLASLYFYAAFSPLYVLLLVGVTAVAYAGALAISSSEELVTRRVILAAAIITVVSALLVFKYYGFVVGTLEGWFGGSEAPDSTSIFPRFPRLDLVLTVGLSFYTFSCISYLADVYAGRLEAERHFGHFAVYVSYFPKLLAGPIERAGPFLAQIREPVVFSAAGVGLGLQLMLWGLFKKVVIADYLAIFVDGAYAQPAFAAPADLLLATYFFAFQLYCDFSGYSDMAIGASMVLGIRLMDNFRRPYLSTSTREFWSKRWHLSLAAWFRDYVYIPLGGSRVSRPRRWANVMAVFLLSGLWHGANWTFVVWGGLNGLYHVVGEITHKGRARLSGLLRVPSTVQTAVAALVTFHLILATWVFFRAASLADAMMILERLAGSFSVLPSLVLARVSSTEVLYAFSLIAFLLAVEILDERKPVWKRIGARPVVLRWGFYYALIAALLLLGRWQLQSFVYMQF
jgi:alginate O-acetyltransferase complex protein AlgI